MIKKIAAAIVSVTLAGITWAQVDLNKATEIELDGLKGLGPAMTREVMREREKALFRDWPDVLKRVKGIGPKKAANLSDQGVRVKGQGYGQAPAYPPQKP
ncbi:helix-hairpin-helix domain-containing protein [Limnohabitans sp. Rim47]|jgi:competence protein ComEA|uniref:ComEA family DNA-binding protein n=1 Tax=Limnohabitans sp. Rim47 TaxID=1100721 RepID=UPI0002FBEA37|nr:helix-hairpin-helix domain-containing protein [Limnohabitans sp. Rim47]